MDGPVFFIVFYYSVCVFTWGVNPWKLNGFHNFVSYRNNQSYDNRRYNANCGRYKGKPCVILKNYGKHILYSRLK